LGWPTEPAVRRADDGVSRRLDRSRLKALGNAVVPQIPELLGRAWLEATELET
jgi:DNA (cytosine-5)-methyltransferase 1